MSVNYKYHRFPIEIISNRVWLYYTFSLSFRDIEATMLYRDIDVTYESIWKWCIKFAQAYANGEEVFSQTFQINKLCPAHLGNRQTQELRCG